MLWKQILLDYWKKILIIVASLILLITTFTMNKFHSHLESSTNEIQKSQITITIKGDVNQSGTYTIPSHMNISEAITQFAKGIKTVENPQIDIEITNPNKEPFKPIPINSASLSELEKISGIGRTKAQKIIDYRNQNGFFYSKEDLMEVPGFGKATVEKILPYIEFNSK